MKKKATGRSCCAGAAFSMPFSLPERPLLTGIQAARAMALFKVLANDTRLRLLHHLARSGEESVSGLAGALGMKPQAVSNQLQRLSDTGILASRRGGNSIYYRISNPCVPLLLDTALCILDDPGAAARVFEASGQVEGAVP
jgi:ArsR family transcriptional regulator, lead/cadmium/zinc/bismuth-responsive transcriptional repressor